MNALIYLMSKASTRDKLLFQIELSLYSIKVYYMKRKNIYTTSITYFFMYSHTHTHTCMSIDLNINNGFCFFIVAFHSCLTLKVFVFYQRNLDVDHYRIETFFFEDKKTMHSRICNFELYATIGKGVALFLALRWIVSFQTTRQRIGVWVFLWEA